MISTSSADLVLLVSLLVSFSSYVYLSKHEGSYLNLLTPSFVPAIPAIYLLPWFFAHVFGTGASPYAFIYVYATVALENVIFVYVYTRPKKKLFRLPFFYSYKNFDVLSYAFLGTAVLMYVPILLQFPEYLLSPRQIYEHTRTGFGVSFYISSTFAYLAVIMVLFSKKNRWLKGAVTAAAAIVLSLHGSKGQVLSLVSVLLLFEVYVRGRKLKFWPSLLVGVGMSVFVLLLFLATMSLGESPADMLEGISRYSDYTRNAILIIDSHYPMQYGKLTMEGEIIGRIPRVLMPDKPRSFGGLRLADQYYPEAMDADAGAPDFGMGVQYADFGAFAIVYLAGFAALRGWLARVFAGRLRFSRHPADFVLFIFMASVSIFAVGGIGWLLPEVLVVAVLLRFASGVGSDKIYRERIIFKPRFGTQAGAAKTL